MDIKEIICKAGGPAVVGAMFGISGQAVSQWKRIPPERCLSLAEAIADPSITVHSLRPDVFGPAPTKSKSRAA